MADMREFKEVIKNAVADERHLDRNWTWRINGITKNEIRIGWGYLDYCGIEDCFKVKAQEVDDEVMITIHDHWGDSHGAVLVGQKFWDDAEDVSKGLKIAINALANMAHSLY